MNARPPAVITLKLATSLDGRIALANGQSQWITGEESRAAVHGLRAEHDLILTGVGTILADDPAYTIRGIESHEGSQPDLAVLDSHGRTPEDAQIFDALRKVYILTVASERSHANAEVLSVSADDQTQVDFTKAVEVLEKKGYSRIMVEAGGRVAASAIQSGRVDRIVWYRAPVILGADGYPVIAELGLETLSEAYRYDRKAVRTLGSDLEEIYERKSD